MLSEQDKEQIKQRGSDLSVVEQQLQNFEKGFPFVNLKRAATLGDGILQISENELAEYMQKYDEALTQKSVVKFVPASGAASRMFKALFSFMDSYSGSESDQQAFEQNEKLQPIRDFFREIKKFAFYEDLKRVAQADGFHLEEGIAKKQYAEVLRYLLTEKGLNYGNLPKGLLKFHTYNGSARTPVEEHMVEGAAYGKDAKGIVKLHFTVSPEHDALFTEKVKSELTAYEDKYNVSYNISFSNQKKSTDTLAVDLDNQPFRNEDGTILFRPAGHGALIENLDEIEADIIFIKNIDNVVPDHLKEATYQYKKVIAGILVTFQQKCFGYISQLEQEVTEASFKEIQEFTQQTLGVEIPKHFPAMGLEAKRHWLLDRLNRPLRVCGMVKNEGEPGGGPFWAEDSNGITSLQIVESAQIDMEDKSQAKIVNNATHFNPVDLVCAVRDANGANYNLLDYRDPQTGFITQKSKDGQNLKAQELPGLWNGAMAYWNTIFVEVPISTFNPVKTVNDLLRPQHQS